MLTSSCSLFALSFQQAQAEEGLVEESVMPQQWQHSKERTGEADQVTLAVQA